MVWPTLGSRMAKEENILFAKYTWPAVKDKHIKMKPRIHVLFVFDLDGECKFIKKKTM